MNTPPQVDENSTIGYEQAMSSEYGSSAASVMGNFSVHGVSRTASGRDTSAVIMINLVESFNKMVSLPPINTWHRLSRPTVCAMGRVQMQIRTSGMFLKRTTPWASTYSVLCGKGHLVLYAREDECLGYALCLASAKRLDMSCGRIEQFDNKTKTTTTENYCTITVKWKFGTLFIQLPEAEIEPWRSAFIDAFDGRSGEPLVRVSPHLANENGVRRSMSLANRAHYGCMTEAPITEEETSIPSELTDALSGMETDGANDITGSGTKGGIPDTENHEHGTKCLSHSRGTSHATSNGNISECKTPKVDGKTNSENLADSEDDHFNSNMWSDDEPTERMHIPQAMRRSYYASLPMSFAHRYRSDGALRLVPRGDRRSERQPLMEWLTQVGADDRFRRARTYFETGYFPPSPANKN